MKAKSAQKTTTSPLCFGTRTIAKEIAKATGVKLETVNHILKVLPFHILRHIVNGNFVRLTSLGRFAPIKRKARTGVDLKGRSILWPPTIRMQFVPCSTIRKSLQEAAKNNES